MANFQNGAPVTTQTGAYNTYVGARYVPLFAGQWDNTKIYEPLTIVINEGNSYTSKQYVPAGVDITNENYWVLSANFNGQIEQVRTELKSEINYLQQNSYLLKGGNQLVPNTHLNNLTTPGNYFCPGPTIGQTIIGRPKGNIYFFTLKVAYGTGLDTPTQILQDMDSGIRFFRTKFESGWGKWTYPAEKKNEVFVTLTDPFTTPSLSPTQVYQWVIEFPAELSDKNILAITPKIGAGTVHNDSVPIFMSIAGGTYKIKILGTGEAQTFNLQCYIFYTLKNPFTKDVRMPGEGSYFEQSDIFYPMGMTKEEVDLYNASYPID